VITDRTVCNTTGGRGEHVVGDISSTRARSVRSASVATSDTVDCVNAAAMATCWSIGSFRCRANDVRYSSVIFTGGPPAVLAVALLPAPPTAPGLPERGYSPDASASNARQMNDVKFCRARCADSSCMNSLWD
jgi:hypothetical protein